MSARGPRPRAARQARPGPDDRHRPGARVRGRTTRSSGASPPSGRTAPGSRRASSPGSTGSPARAARRGPHARARRSSATRARSSMQFLRPIASHAHDPTYSMGDDTALAPLAGRAAPALPLLQAALRAGHEPADRPPARAVRDVAAHGARQPRAAPVGGPRGRRRDRARELLPLPGRARAVLARPARRDLRPRTRGSRPPASGSPTTPEAAVRAGAGMLLISDTAPGGRRSRRSWRPGIVHHRLVAHGSCARRRRSSSRPTRPARCTTSPACSATAPRRSARGSRSRRWPRWPRPTRSAATARRPPRRSCASGRRSRTASSR